nr:hypothetical protein CFP56_40058 [Quercus suber]
MVLHEELPIPVSSLLEPAYGEWSQQEELRSNDFQTLRNFRARSSFANSSGAPIGSLVTFVVSDITLKSQKFKNVAYMKMNQIQKIMNYERNPIGSFPQMKSKKSCHVMVNDKLVVEEFMCAPPS